MLIDVLLVVGDNGLGDSLTDGVDLGGVTTTGDADADIDTGELVNADDEEGLVDLKFEHGLSDPDSATGSRCHCRVAIRTNPFSYIACGRVG